MFVECDGVSFGSPSGNRGVDQQRRRTKSTVYARASIITVFFLSEPIHSESLTEIFDKFLIDIFSGGAQVISYDLYGFPTVNHLPCGNFAILPTSAFHPRYCDKFLVPSHLCPRLTRETAALFGTDLVL